MKHQSPQNQQAHELGVPENASIPASGHGQPTLRRLLPALLAALLPLASAAEPLQAKDNEVIILDRFEVTAGQSSSLPLDAAPPTGSRLEIANRDLPASISILTQESLQLRGARTAVEAVENAVGMTGGISVGSIPNYATRGFTGNDVTILHDGIRQNTASQSSRPLDSFLYDRIEILNGPASLLYGEGAIGGAVNYVSKLPDTTAHGEVQFSAGSWDTYRAAAGFGGPLTSDSGLGYRLDLSHQKSGGYVERSESEMNGFSGAVRWTANQWFSLTFTGMFLKDDIESYYGTPVVYDAVIDQNGKQVVRKASTTTDTLVNARIAEGTRRTNYDNLDNFARSENSFWRLIAEAKPSAEFNLRNEAYVSTQWLDWRNTESYTWNPVTRLVDRGSFLLIYRDDLIVGDRVDLTLKQSFGDLRNQILVGGLFEHSDMIRNSGQSNYASAMASVSLLDPDVGYGPDVRYQKTIDVLVDTAAVYAEDMLELTPKLKLLTGLRWEKIETRRKSLLGAAPFTKQYTPLTGRSGVVWTATPGLNLYASYTKAAQPVSQLISLSSSQADFALQKGRQLEAGAKGTFWDKRLDLTLALFDIEKNDLLTSTIIDDVRISQQIGAQVSQGAELALAFSPATDWRVEGNLAWTWKAEYKDYNENLGAGIVSRAGNTPPNVPELVAGLFVVRSLGAWQFTTGARHVGERPANTANTIFMGAYTTWDASVGYRWRKATITLRVRNLTDETYAAWASGSGLMQRLADPRSFELGVRYSY